MPQETDRPLLTVDLGGTKILAALISFQGKIIAREYTSTEAEESPGKVISNIIAAMDKVIHKANITRSHLAAVVIAAAGALDLRKGMVTTSPNLPGWCNVPLRDIIHRETGVETFLVNDASAAALGEHRFGAGRGATNMIYLTVSTGIGGGIIIDNKLYGGAVGAAGEIGHMIIEVNGPLCNCGNRGCLEALASGGAVAREAIRRLKQKEKSLLSELSGNAPENITAQLVHLAALQGDALALEIVHNAATSLGIGLANVINIFNPERIVIGGGVSRMGDMLLTPARKVASERAFPLLFQAASIALSELGDNAGVLGAAAFVAEEIKGRTEEK